MTRIETGAAAAGIGALAAATVQVGDGTILAILTVVTAPLAGALWREREKRFAAERALAEFQQKADEGKRETADLHDEVRALRTEVRGITARSRSPGAERFPYHSTRSRERRPTPSRSTGRSRRSGRGSGGGSGSGATGRT